MSVIIFPEVYFYYDIPIELGRSDRRNLKAIFKDMIKTNVDSNRHIHLGENLASFNHLTGHLTDFEVAGKLAVEVDKLNDDPDHPDRFQMTELATLCYVVRSGQIICYHCYGLTDEGSVVKVTMSNEPYPLLIAYAYPAPF